MSNLGFVLLLLLIFALIFMAPSITWYLVVGLIIMAIYYMFTMH